MPQRKAAKKAPTPIPDEVLKEIEAYGQAYEDHLVRAMAGKDDPDVEDGGATE
jgi:hypothetical protein